MGIFDDLSGFAKNVSDKAVEAANVGKLSVNIKVEQAKIDDVQKKIGAYYYERHLNGLPVDPDIQMYIDQIDMINENIASLEGQKKEAKNNFNANDNTPEYCSNCGAKLQPGSNFCNNCGKSVN